MPSANSGASSKQGASSTSAVLLSGLLISAGLGFGWACGGDDPPPQTPVQPSATFAATPPSATPSASATQAPPPGPSPIAPIEPALAQAAQAVLDQVAKTEAPPGAKAMGLPTVALLTPGQTSESQLSMAPGKCYTIISVGLPPVAEIDVQLLPATTVPGLQTAMAQDNMVGPRAIVGKAPNCFKWPLPIAGAARVVAAVTSGQGLIATQVYEQ
jgi:hypothetical protein